MSEKFYETTQVDAAAILTSIWTRNALRREAQLPLLPVRTTFERELHQARWSAHVEQHYAATRERVLAEQRARRGQGWGLSVGGRWGTHLLTMKVLQTSFRAPTRRPERKKLWRGSVRVGGKEPELESASIESELGPPGDRR